GVSSVQVNRSTSDQFLPSFSEYQPRLLYCDLRRALQQRDCAMSAYDSDWLQALCGTRPSPFLSDRYSRALWPYRFGHSGHLVEARAPFETKLPLQSIFQGRTGSSRSASSTRVGSDSFPTPV